MTFFLWIITKKVTYQTTIKKWEDKKLIIYD